MATRIVVIGGGAAGIGAAGAARATDPDAEVRVFTEFEDVGYSPCGIPYVHGREIDSFERLFLADKETYEQAGIDIAYETRVSDIDLGSRTVTVEGTGPVPFDRLVIATGFNYEPLDVPGSELGGLYHVKNIRQAMEWDRIIEEARSAVVVEATPLGMEMVTALAHRGLEVHLVDPNPWLLADAADPDIMQPVEESLIEMGVKLHLRTKLQEFVGDRTVQAVRTSDGEIPADIAVVCTHKRPSNKLAADAGLKIGSTGGVIVNAHMATSVEGVFAAGDCVELPHEVTQVPVVSLTGSHAYAQGKVAGTSAAGGDRRYNPVYVPWGMVAGKWMIGGASTGETLATALGMPFMMGVAEGISRARYYPGVMKVKVKLLFDPASRHLIGAQMVGGEGIKERADFLGMAIKKRVTVDDLASMENVYSPPIGALNEPIALAAQNCLARLEG
ncbi:MAG TPA: FAD-dependent oxidoreductase [Jiangellaceae bacterium]